MTDKIKLVQGDTRPQIKVAVKDDATGTALDVSGATVRLLFRAVGASALQATLVGTLVTGLEQADGSILTTAPYDVPGAGGRVVFAWATGDLNCEAGPYEGEIQVTFQDGTRQTVFETLQFTLREDFSA